MKCVSCGGKVVKREVTFTYEKNGKFLIIEHVPAKLCVRCGEKMYLPDVADELLHLALKGVKLARKIEILVYNLQQTSE
jgi:HTH-type transcriptional regulator/antitoxin MqsA